MSFNFRVSEDLYAAIDKMFGSKLDKTKPWTRADLIRVALNYSIAKVMVGEQSLEPVPPPTVVPPTVPLTPPTRYPALVRPPSAPIETLMPEDMFEDKGCGL